MNDRIDAWRLQAIEDFARWLARLPDDWTEDHRIDEDQWQGRAPDLHSLYSEFVSLRQEVKGQNREQARALRQLQGVARSYQDAIDLLRTHSRELATLEERIRRSVERSCVLPFLSLRDALVRGLQSTLKIAGGRSFWRRPATGIDGIVEGYELAIEHFDKALTQLGVRRIPTLGELFDPHHMSAVESRRVTGVPEGCVMEEFSSGFVRESEVLRPAEVAVNRLREE